MPFHRNISFAAADSLRDLLSGGATVAVRDQLTRELRNRVTTLARPRERCLFIPGRFHDIFGQIAETMWVLAGRDDIPWLSAYLERAPAFSDDGGATWRGAYGPRLRRWSGGVDQIAAWKNLFDADLATRRAVGVLFDPDRDFDAASLDIPCTNWLSWLVRDGRLNLSIAVRSNDVIWGFSGINAFEWSVLQEMMAHWLGVAVGDLTFLATSFHLYERHFSRAETIARSFTGLSPYDFAISSPPFATSWQDFPRALNAWFTAEAQLRDNPEAMPAASAAMDDPFIACGLRMLRLKWGAGRWSVDRLKDELAAMPENDFTVSAYEAFGRRDPDILSRIPHTKIAAYVAACQQARSTDAVVLKAAIKRLHALKNAAYRGSWRKRGERVSILPNIGRKVDRLDTYFIHGSQLADETILDTAVDLLVYAVKYAIYLAGLPGADRTWLPASIAGPESDTDDHVDAVIDSLTMTSGGRSVGDLAREIQNDFEHLWQSVDAGADLSDRQRGAIALMTMAAALVSGVADAFPDQSEVFLANQSPSGN